MCSALKIISILFLFYCLYPLTLVLGTVLKQCRVDWHRTLALHANIKIGMLGSYWCCKNYHKFHGLNPNTDLLSYSSRGHKCKIGLIRLKWGSPLGCAPSTGSRGDSVSWPLPVSRSLLHCLARGLFLHVQGSSIFKSFSVSLSLIHTLYIYMYI